MKRTYRQLSGLTGDQTRASLRRFNLSLGFRTVFDAVGGGATFIFVAFARSLGVAKEQMGWLTFIGSCACLLQMAAIPLIGRVRNKKRFALTLAVMEPILAIIAVILALFLPPGYRLIAFVSAVFMAAASVHLARPVQDDWFASMIPAAIRGRYLGRRLQIASVIVVITTLILGIVGENIGMTNRWGLGLLVIAGAFCGVVAVAVLREVPMPQLAAESRPRVEDFMGVLKTRHFMRLMLLTVLYNIPFFFACPYYQVFHLEVANMPASIIAVSATGYYIVKAFALPYLGRTVDRWGPRKTMYVSGAIYSWFFSTYLFCSPGWYWPILVGWTGVALADGAFGLAAQIALFEALPTDRARPAYFAVYNIISLILSGAGALLAVPLLSLIKDVVITVGPFRLGNFHLLYGFCALAMIPCLFAARLVPPRTGEKERKA